MKLRGLRIHNFRSIIDADIEVLIDRVFGDDHREAADRRRHVVGPPDGARVEAHVADGNRSPGWVELGWSRPTGEELEAVVAKLKALKLTIRNTPMDAPAPSGTCPFTGQPAVETIYVARSY